MKTVLLSSFVCKTCNKEHDRRKTSVSKTRTNWLHLKTKCSRCSTTNLVIILG